MLFAVVLATFLAEPMQPLRAATAISSVEVTQVMGKGIDLASGEYYFMNTFVAEKPAAIQVVMTEALNIDAATMSLDIYYQGSSQPLATLKPVNSGKQQIIDFIPAKNAVNGWKAGRYKFTARIDGQEKTTEAIFNESKTFSVLFIPGRVKFDGQICEAPAISASTVSLRAQLMPVSENKFIRKYRKAPIDFGTGSLGYDIATPEGRSRFLSDIEQYRLKSASQYDVVVVLVDSRLDKSESTGGYTDSQHAVVVSLHGKPSSETLEAITAHEIGHIFGNGDEYEGGDVSLNVNGLPYNVRGYENGQSVVGARRYLQHADGNTYSGVLLHEVQNAYNPKTAAPILRVSSFMGSSYKHWPTSMVWEQMYRRLISNSNNILPRVYTDGKVVAKRASENDLSETELNDLKAQFRAMLNEVRQEYGLAPYPEDKILAAGDKHLQILAEEEFAKGTIAALFDLTSANDGMLAELGMSVRISQCEAALYEYERDELEYMRGFYSQSPCGASAITDDYFFLAFIRANNTVYYVRASYSGFYDKLPDDEELQPQPEVLPELEINPVTDEPVQEQDYYEPAPFTPEGTSIDQPIVDPDDRKPSDSSEPSDDDAKPKPDAATGFAALPQDEKIRRLLFDNFDLGYTEAGLADFSYDDLMDFYAWYFTDAYGIAISSDDARRVIDEAMDAAFTEYHEVHQGIGQVDSGLMAEHLFRAYQLYPAQEVREAELYRMYYPYTFEDYGENPKRSRYDTDAIHYDDPDVVYDDDDIEDPDGGW